MKNLKFISPIPFIIFVISLFMPFAEYSTDFNEIGAKIQYGYDLNMVYVPVAIMLFILIIVNVWRTRFVAIVSFVLCFGVLFSLFLTQFEMKPVSYSDPSLQIGYFVALFSIPLLMVILLVNLVKTFKKSKK